MPVRASKQNALKAKKMLTTMRRTLKLRPDACKEESKFIYDFLKACLCLPTEQMLNKAETLRKQYTNHRSIL